MGGSGFAHRSREPPSPNALLCGFGGPGRSERLARVGGEAGPAFPLRRDHPWPSAIAHDCNHRDGTSSLGDFNASTQFFQTVQSQASRWWLLVSSVGATQAGEPASARARRAVCAQRGGSRCQRSFRRKLTRRAESFWIARALATSSSIASEHRRSFGPLRSSCWTSRRSRIAGRVRTAPTFAA